MACVCSMWDPCRNEDDPWQDGVLEAWGCLWPPQVMEEAKACIVGLENMLSHQLSPSAVSRQEPLVAWRPHEAEYELNVMIAWCKSVALGRMPQGPLLAMAKMEGDEIVKSPAGQHLGPKHS